MLRWKFSLVVLLSVVLTCLSRVDARIVVGVSTVNVAFLPIYLTQDKGFFKDEGLDVLVVMFNAGATNLQAMIGGDVQIMAGGVPETVLARAGGADIKNFWAISNVMPFQIYGSAKLKSCCAFSELASTSSLYCWLGSSGSATAPESAGRIPGISIP